MHSTKLLAEVHDPGCSQELAQTPDVVTGHLKYQDSNVESYLILFKLYLLTLST